MKQPRILRRVSTPLVMIALICSLIPNPGCCAQTQPATSNHGSVEAQALSAEGQAGLRAAISGGNLPDLRWPNFSDYRKHVQKFYELNGNSLWWVKGMEPTPQARR